ncbi:MAG: FecR domain-containing protein, partial [Moraxellaceae bacterium]|nr:FecR domain-containing protein [Moraxellaceae bacterium]
MRGFWSILVLMLLPGLVTAAPCRVGEVVRLVGDVSVVRPARQFTPILGMKICIGDRFVTGPSSIAELRLRDGSLITVGKGSDFTVREYRIYRNKPNVALFDLSQGAFRSITGFITRRAHRFEVRTAVATIGVRGTDFWGGYGLTENGLD